MKKISLIIGTTVFITLSSFYFLSKNNYTKMQAADFDGLTTDCSKEVGLAKVVCLAEAFKSTLKDDQLALLQLEYSKKDAVRWSNFPQAFSRPNRVGINLGSLSSNQLAAFKTLMAAVLGQGVANEGYDEMEGILAADDYFGKTTGQTTTFGSRNYFVAFLGKPSTTTLWELQCGGHHFAFANTYSGGKTIGVTPTFRGVEPMAAVTANGKTYQPIEQEREAFSNIIETLNTQEKVTAKLSGTFTDVLLGPGRDGQFPNTKQGIKVGALSSMMQKQVIAAIKLYVNDLDAVTAKEVMAKYSTELEDTYLSFSGSGTMKQENDYIRLDGPSIWLEYVVQPSRDFPGTTHPHSVWRDHKSDYGGN